jgi:hypothetical protein
MLCRQGVVKRRLVRIGVPGTVCSATRDVWHLAAVPSRRALPGRPGAVAP